MVRVRVAEGFLEGTKEINKYGGEFYSFRGVPYAEPPLGDLRFKAPQPKTIWTGVRMAKKHGPICCQYDSYVTKKGSEDCLYLNIYTPELKPSNLLPVMFWIHGGSLTSGSGNDDLYGPEFLSKHEVVLVTINYRLEVLGFLCLHSKDVPGNAGMKDQVAALRWVNKNISNFGGDPNNVTIFGESAGGGSVSFHCLSPMSKGLFKRAIIQSGCATSWLPNVTLPKERYLALAKEMGCNSEDDLEVYNFFKSQPAENLINKQIKLTFLESTKEYVYSSFGVVQEKEFEGVERFFYEDVYDALRRGIHDGIDLMNGYTEDEGIIFLAGGRDLTSTYNQANKYAEFFVPKPFEINYPINIQLEIGKRIKTFYFQNQNVSNEKLNQLIKFVTSEFFVYPAVLMQKTIAKLHKNKLYLYKFTCKSKRNVFTQLIGLSNLFKDKTVVCHGDDLPYIFPFKVLGQDIDKTSREYKMIENVTKLWTNFAKYGDPTPDDVMGKKWLPYTIEEENYMDIGENLKPGLSPDAEQVEFWNSIFKEFCPHISIK